MSKQLVVGFDPHRKKNVVQVMDSQGQVLDRPFGVANQSTWGQRDLSGRLWRTPRLEGVEGIQISTEATGWYWFHFFRTLSEDPLLNQWPLELYLFNPRLTAKFKQSYGDLDKNDQIDAFVVADRFRFGRDLPVPFRYEQHHWALRFLTRHYFHVTHNLAREKSLHL